MNQGEQMETWNGVVVAAPAWFVRNKRPRYGSVPGLLDEELANPRELERQVFLQEWGPILTLPVRRARVVEPNIDEYFGVNWGAFATVDFSRTMARPDPESWEMRELREQLRNSVAKIEILVRRLPRKAVYRVLDEVELGRLDIDEIVNVDMWWLANEWLYARRIRRQIAELQERRRKRQREACVAMFGTW